MSLKDVLDTTFLEECESVLGKVAKAIHENLESFDMNDVTFWRTFLRFKHYLKILKSVSNYEEKSTRTTEKVIRSMLENLVKVQVCSSEDLENQCKTLTDQSKLFLSYFPSYYLNTRRVVVSMNQAESSGFSFRIA